MRETETSKVEHAVLGQDQRGFGHLGGEVVTQERPREREYAALVGAHDLGRARRRHDGSVRERAPQRGQAAHVIGMGMGEQDRSDRLAELRDGSRHLRGLAELALRVHDDHARRTLDPPRVHGSYAGRGMAMDRVGGHRSQARHGVGEVSSRVG